jgi:ankyrin repeat protein
VDRKVDNICGRDVASIWDELEDSPETLAYQHTLQHINEADSVHAHRLFQFVAMASRPIRVEELADLLAFDFKAGPIPQYHEHWRREDQAQTLLSICSSLVSIVDGGHRFGKVVQFSHISVKEYLTSSRLAEASNISGYHVSATPAHTLIAQACLSILLHLDKDVVTSDSLQESPLAEYAAENWADHARFEDVSRNVEDGMKELFDPSKSHLAVCIWIHDPEATTQTRTDRAERPSPLTGAPLHYAALWGLRTIVKFLVIEHSQDVHPRGLTGMVTPLHLASKKGHADITGFLLEHGADAGARDNDNCTALHWASQEGHLEVVCVLIEHGSDVNARDHSNWTPLHGASQGGHLEVVQILLEHGADTRASDQGGWTPLQWPSYHGYSEIVWELLEHGADANTRDHSNWTPFHGASQQGHKDVACFLLEHGGDANARDNDRYTPLHWASKQGHLEMVRFLLECGADARDSDQGGWTSLQWPSYNEDPWVLSERGRRGADVDTRDNSKWTPLHCASQQGHREVVQVLLEHGAHENSCDNSKQTPLHLASRAGHLGPVQLLVESSADVHALNNEGRTPFEEASLKGHHGIMQFLLEYGARGDVE